MELQSVCCSRPLKNRASNPILSSPIITNIYLTRAKTPTTSSWWRNRRFQLTGSIKCCSQPLFHFVSSAKKRNEVFSLSNSNIESASTAYGSDEDTLLRSSVKTNANLSVNGSSFDYREPFRGKSGLVTFCGLSHEALEERKLVSSPFKDGTGSLVWIVGPIALMSALVLPQFFLNNAIDAIVRDEILADILISLSSEALFYFGLATFLSVTDHVQRPYLQFSSKRWALITGLRGYLSSAIFTMGFKIFAPLMAVYVVWPVVGLPALVSVAPFLIGCGAQLAFEAQLEKRKSSCWPLVPIIFEVYRLYQLSRAANFIERLMMEMKGMATTPDLLERSGALFSMVVVFQVLGLVCLWSLITFLLRLFPSRPVSERY